MCGPQIRYATTVVPVDRRPYQKLRAVRVTQMAQSGNVNCALPERRVSEAEIDFDIHFFQLMDLNKLS